MSLRQMRAGWLLVIASCAARESAVVSPPIANEVPSARREAIDLPLVSSMWQLSGGAEIADGWLDLEFGNGLTGSADARTPELRTGRWRLAVNHANDACKDGTLATVYTDEGVMLDVVALSGSSRSTVATVDVDLTAPAPIRIRIEGRDLMSCAGSTVIRQVRLEPY
jgi:hypothetical protein